MEFYIDTANLEDIEAGLKRGFATGVTTNPSLLSKEPKALIDPTASFEEQVEKIIGLIKKYAPGIHLSVEVFSNNPDEIVRQAQTFIQKFNYPQLSVKVQVGWDELESIRQLSQMGISVNCTACMDITQAVMAARAGAAYVSLFWGRIRDGGAKADVADIRDEAMKRGVLDSRDFDPAFITGSVRKIFDEDKNINTKIIVGSIRTVLDIRDAMLAGAHIVTVPPKFFPDMMRHFKTDETVEQFLNDFKSWLS